jgi:hypothetical protein
MKRITLTFIIFYWTLIPILSQENKATLYFYRPWKYSGAISNLQLFVNSEKVNSISNNSTAIWETNKEGLLEIGVKGWGLKMNTVKINVHNGNSYFLKVGYTMTGTEIQTVPYSSVKDIFPGLDVNMKTLTTTQANESNNVIVRTDTVIKKEIVYVNNTKSTSYQFEKKSDVDQLSPQTVNTHPYRFALVIGNEDYSSHQIDLSSEINVDFARNDASAFKEYAINTLGIPDKNVIFLLDATTGQMNQGISKLNLIIKNTQGNAEAFVYYAGHGLPDEQTKEAYIMPVDVSGKNSGEGIKLKDMYSKLTEYPSRRITVFIDACFSGGARNQGLLAARGVKVKAKEDILNGNLVVFSASSGEQSSLPYKEKQHGIFTYYLLKKLQETKGNVNYSELSKYIKDIVSLQSVLINDKEQSPQVNVSNSIQGDWGKYDLK